jgi:hypothetical protein
VKSPIKSLELNVCFSSYLYHHSSHNHVLLPEKRYIPIVPALPNGLKDAFDSSNRTPISPPHPRQKGMFLHTLPYLSRYITRLPPVPPVSRAVASLLNPCQCDDVWNCGCRTSTELEAPHNSEFASTTPTFSPSGNNSASSARLSSDGLETLARAAALFSSPLTPRSPANSSAEIPTFSGTNEHALASPVLLHTASPPSPKSNPTPVFDLPPLLFPEVPGPTPVVPPFSTFTTLAGSGCTCGLTCQCPDCPNHRSRVNSRDPQDCMNCIDQSLHVIDQSGNSGFHVKSPVLERFLAEAERVPPPPTPGGKPVELPKLSCSCKGVCGCNGDYNSCCRDIEEEASEDPLNDAVAATTAPAMKSCCLGST